MTLIEVVVAATQAQPTDNGLSNIWVALITGAATLAGSWLLFRGQGKQSAAESVVEERKLLATEWGKIREAVDKALEDCRHERDELRHEIDGLCIERDELRRELNEVKAEVAHLKSLHLGE